MRRDSVESATVGRVCVRERVIGGSCSSSSGRTSASATVSELLRLLRLDGGSH